MQTSRISIGSALLLGALACAGCSTSRGPNRAPLPDAETRDYRSCREDSECVWVKNGCCDCANGGEDIAVHRDQTAAFAARFDCAGAVCTTRGREPGCGTGTVACQSGLCVYREPGSQPAP